MQYKYLAMLRIEVNQPAPRSQFRLNSTANRPLAYLNCTACELKSALNSTAVPDNCVSGAASLVYLRCAFSGAFNDAPISNSATALTLLKSPHPSA